MSYILDTTVLVDVLRGDAAALSFLESLPEVPTCSEITRVEVMRGLRSGERGVAERLFHALHWEPVHEDIARIAGEQGRKHRRAHYGIATGDLIVAATAEFLGLPLATSNVRDFPMFPRLRPPYRS